MEKVLFIDRDGTLIDEPVEDQQVDSFDKLKFKPGVFNYLARIAEELNYTLVMVTNQDGLGTSSFPESDFFPVHNFMVDTLASEGIDFEDILIDRSFEYEKLETRKPGLGMVKQYMKGRHDLENSFVIGDRLSDIQLARNMGCKGILFTDKIQDESTVCIANWKEIYEYLKSLPNRVQIKRTTKETNISLQLSPGSTAKSDINTGIGFFDHMLMQLSVHGNMQIDLKVQGDLHVDEHHTIEDTALVLGEAVYKWMSENRGITRYAFVLPMDESLSTVAIDLSGRPHLEWSCDFKREYIGQVPTEMFRHFFKSFVSAARCTLHIKCDGDNEHHKIESIFKAFAKCLSQAMSLNNKRLVPSSKGVL